MIGRLTGIIDGHTKNPLIIDVGGVGYVVSVPKRYLASIQPGTTHTLHIHTHVRDDAIDLYGFAAPAELTLFNLLLTVSGIGPRTALYVVDCGVAAVESAVQRSDVDFFTTIPRLGTKNAQKIIIELKSKLGSSRALDLSDSSGETKEVIDALLSMGFDKHEIRKTLEKLDPAAVSVEQKIRQSLKFLGK
ncbi:Holliday junction DNA helicase RuvA [Candidatus Gottesmanbacteria bacterium RIFCSPLOWO2_01_FULL_46_9]|uniref:Holliday junction branch migration complex subunit RuvA n=1 Tax=Candidatus Gottesmanbacteria bacterium RIFCSPLOWO2_01_FULL_46_9 TaxID=1798394 RepID=A0A1F6B3S9_9BACT|nr:MAG: Holliday junction DNA helicase RuvA [Candidatus Gottesmanbacteria bacterium RIFCSPLOWO2_01_FULL_46_9]